MGKDKNIYDPDNTKHGHFCLRCKYHYLCTFKKCLKLERSSFDLSDKTLYWHTREELVDVANCEFCKNLSDEICSKIRELVASNHFGSSDKRLASVGLFKPE